MNLENLRSFVAVVEHDGFNAASKALSVAQPSLTRRIKRLEAELGERLLERGPWGIRLTDVGNNFFKGAQRILATVEEVQSETNGKWSETIRLGAAATAAGSFLAKMLTDWIPEHPDVHLVMIEDGARNMRQRLEKRECDLGIIAEPVPTNFDHRFITRVTVQALLPATHRLATTDAHLSVSELNKERILLNSEGFLSAELLRSACLLAGIEPETVYECSVGQTLAALAEGGLGIAIMGDSVDLRGFDLPRRHISDRDGNLLTFDLYIAWLHERILPPTMSSLVKRLSSPQSLPK